MYYRKKITSYKRKVMHLFNILLPPSGSGKTKSIATVIKMMEGKSLLRSIKTD